MQPHLQRGENTWNNGNVALERCTQRFTQRNTDSCMQMHQREKREQCAVWPMFFTSSSSRAVSQGPGPGLKDGSWGYKASGGTEAAAGLLQCPTLSNRHRRSVGKTQAGNPRTCTYPSNNSHGVQINSHILSPPNTSRLCLPALPRRLYLAVL